MKKRFYYLLLSLSILLQACDTGGDNSNISSQENFNNSNISINKSTRDQLEDYYQALRDGNKEVIVQYLHADVVQYMNSMTSYEFNLEEFIDEELVKQANHAKEVYSENGVKQSFNVIHESNTIEVGDKNIQSFTVVDILQKGDKVLADTSRIVGISKNGVLKFVSAIEDPEKVLAYSFTEDEVFTILNLVHNGKYQAYLDRTHTKMVNSHVWVLEAFGNNADELAAFKPEVKEAILEQGLGIFPERLSATKGKMNIELIDGKSYTEQFSIYNSTIRFNLPTIGNNFKYVLQQTGVDENGDPIYYLDIYYTDGDKTVVFVYKAQKHTNA